MSGKLKISILVLAGMTLMLSACNTAVDSSSQPTPSAVSQPTLEPSKGKPPAVSQNAPVVAEADRAKYQSIQLGSISSSGSLKGTDPKEMALAAFGKTESEGGSRQVDVNYPQPDQAVVTITHNGVADDSVGGIRYRVEFSPLPQSAQTSKQWQMVWAGSQVKCWPERGHQDWSTQKCQ